MAFLKGKPEERGEITVNAPLAAAEDLRVLAQKCTARELAILRKVAEKPAVKALAMNAAAKYV